MLIKEVRVVALGWQERPIRSVNKQPCHPMCMRTKAKTRGNN